MRKSNRRLNLVSVLPALARGSVAVDSNLRLIKLRLAMLPDDSNYDFGGMSLF